MDMQGSRQLAITQQQAWDALNNPEVLKTCIPGCDRVEATGAPHCCERIVRADCAAWDRQERRRV